MRAHDVVSAVVAGALLVVAAPPVKAAPVDDRLVLTAPNSLGQTGLVRTSSAIIGDTGLAYLGFAGRGFVSSDFVIPGKDDGNTFVEGTAVLGFSVAHVLELSLATRAGANLNTARAQPQASVGDTALTIKGGYGFGLVSAAASVKFGLPTRSNKVGFDLGNANVAGAAHVTFDLLPQGIPLRAHVMGGYTLQLAHLADGDAATNPYFLDGPDGALIALATQQWFYDQVSAGIGVEAPLPYITPFLEVWYQAAIGASDYTYFGDAWLTLTPGVRFGLGGLRVDVAADIGVSGTAGGAAVDVAQVINGQPINPLWTARIAVSHAFDLFGGSRAAGSSPVAGVVVGSGGGNTMGRLEGCITDSIGPVTDAAVAFTVDGSAGPRVLVDDKGCYALPVNAGAVTIAVSAGGHDEATATTNVDRGSTARADVVLKQNGSVGGQGHIVGFVTNKDDETVNVSLQITDRQGTRDAGKSVAGAFDLAVNAGPTLVTATAPGYLAQGVSFNVESGARRTTTFVMRKVPKKRSATLKADQIDTTSRIPFVFKNARLQSTANYVLDEVADLLLTHPAVRISIEAHTDTSEMPDASDAKALTEARAQSVKDALVALGIAPERLETVGAGIKSPIGNGSDPKNRRVEFVVVGP